MQNLLFHKKTPVDATTLGDYLQQAIEIEISTIPTYLYTYYSINRSPNQEVISGQIAAALMTKKEMPAKEAYAKAKDLSADIMVFANHAGALIMSVVIEEMLHLALAANIKQSMVGMPQMTGKSPSAWPAELPGHVPPLLINLAPLSQKQLKTFLEIESPKPLLKSDGAKNKIYYLTIGDFYKVIENYIKDHDCIYSSFRPQLIPGKGYYAANNIDTVYYTKTHEPKTVSSEDSGDLILVKDQDTALQAIQTIVHQGEGNDGKYDDGAKKELCHYDKFKEIARTLEEKNREFAALGLDYTSYFVNNVPTNPTTAKYPAHIQPVSNLINGIYTYIFVMIEGCYAKGGHTQYEIFMFGVHKSMIFILNSLCGDINKLSYKDADGNTKMATATFENYPFGLPGSPKSQLLALYTTAVTAFPAISYLGQRFQDLPDVPLQLK